MNHAVHTPRAADAASINWSDEVETFSGSNHFTHHRETPHSAGYNLERSTLEVMAMDEMLSLYDAITLAKSTLEGVINQPRFWTGQDFNAAGNAVEVLLDHLMECRALIVDVADKALPSLPEEADRRAWLLLKYFAEMRDGLPAFAVLATKLVSFGATVEFHDRHARGKL